MRRSAKLVSTRRVKDCDAGLYVSILTRSHLLGSPLPSCPNLTVYGSLPQALPSTGVAQITIRDQRSNYELSTSRNRFSVKYSG